MTDIEPHFSLLLGAEDDKDKEINFATTGMVIGLNVHNFIFNEQKLFDAYFSHVLAVATSLQKANAHRRKYKIEEIEFLKEYLKKHSDISSHDQSTTAISLSRELDGFLSQYKAALDSLAKTLQPIYKISIGGWHKEKNVSGQRIINALNNLGSPKKEKAQRLINFLQDTQNWVTTIVNLRDAVNHDGGLKGVTNVYFEKKNNVVHPQKLVFIDGPVEVKVFMDSVLDQTIEFVETFLLLGIESCLPGNDMIIVKNEMGEFPPFRFAIKKKR